MGESVAKTAVMIAVCIAAPVALPGTARGQGEPPSPKAPAIDQYVEAVPTASGPSAPGITKERRTPLPPKTKRTLKQASPSTGDALEKIATSSTYGAPKVRSTRPTKVGPKRKPDVVPRATSLSAGLQSGFGELGTASDARLLGLLIVVFGTTAGAIALAARRAGA